MPIDFLLHARFLILWNLILLLIGKANAQETGFINSKQPNPKAGEENYYAYSPPKGLLVPQKARASIIFFNKQFSNKVVPLTKSEDKYGV